MLDGLGCPAQGGGQVGVRDPVPGSLVGVPERVDGRVRGGTVLAKALDDAGQGLGRAEERVIVGND